MIRLKPCPFCGSEKILILEDGIIECQECPCAIENDLISEEELIAAWNHRTLINQHKTT